MFKYKYETAYKCLFSNLFLKSVHVYFILLHIQQINIAWCFQKNKSDTEC